MLDQEVDEVHVVLEVCCLELAKLDVRCFCLKELVHPNVVRRLGIAVLIKLDLKTRDPSLRPGSKLGCQKSISRDLVDGILNRSEEHTSELQSRDNLVCRLLLENNIA